MHPLLDHLRELGAVFCGTHTEAELRDALLSLGLVLPNEFLCYFTEFRTCQNLDNSGWDFFSYEHAVRQTKLLREHREVILTDEARIESVDVFAFCDYLIDAPSYYVVARPASKYYGWILADQAGEGWFVGDGLMAFLRAFRRDGDYGLLFADS